MSGNCPSCDGENYEQPWETSPALIGEQFDDTLTECLDCGFYIRTYSSFLDLDEINENRDICGLPELPERKKLTKVGNALWELTAQIDWEREKNRISAIKEVAG